MFVGILFVVGTIGFMMLGEDFVHAIYQTGLVLTTVGFTPEDRPGAVEKIFTASLAFGGVVAFFGTLAVFTSALVEGHIGMLSRRRRMDRRIAALNNHYIICAYGRVARAAARELEAEGVPFVVIDRLEELEERMRADGVHYIIADPTSDAVLREAGIERARGLVSAVDSDADNVYITLTARSMRPELFIVARASESAAADRLYRAGADRVISPYVSSGRHMAMLALRPRIVDYIDIAGRGDETLRLEEVLIDERSPLVGLTLGAVSGGATPLVIRREGNVLSNPAASELLQAGDLLVLLGRPADLRRVEEVAH